MANRPHRPVTSVMMGNNPTLPDEAQRNIPIDPRGRDIQRQMYLAELLRDMGDYRYGGVLPIGGKPFGGVPSGRRKSPGNLFGHTPNDEAERQAYDHQMNMYESELEDLRRSR